MEDFMNKPQKLKVGDVLAVFGTPKQTFKLLQKAGCDGKIIETSGGYAILITKVPEDD